MAADVEHWLADEPVAAYPEPLRERACAAGDDVTAAWSAGLAALLLTATAALAVGLVLVNAEKNRTAEAERKTRQALEQVTEEQNKTADALQRVTEEQAKTQKCWMPSRKHSCA